MADPADSAPALDTRQLNRAVLARQLLLQRADLAIATVLEQMGFLQAQYAPSMYIGLFSRIEGFHRDDLTRALEDREVVQGTLLRATIHLVSARDWWPAAFAIREHRRRWWLAAHRAGPALAADVEAAATTVRQLLGDGPRKRAAIVAEAGIDSRIWSGVNLWLDLVRVPPSGTWDHRRADLYALAEDWIGPPPADLSEGAGLQLLLTRYLTGFGPASLADAANWAGLPAKVLQPVADRLPLRRFQDEKGKPLLDLPDGPLPRTDVPAPVRFLPTWDATLLAHARRALILREEHRPLLFSTKSPQSVASFLVDGQVSGTWRYEGTAVQLDPFQPLPSRVVQELEAEAELVAQFHA